MSGIWHCPCAFSLFCVSQTFPVFFRPKKPWPRPEQKWLRLEPQIWRLFSYWAFMAFIDFKCCDFGVSWGTFQSRTGRGPAAPAGGNHSCRCSRLHKYGGAWQCLVSLIPRPQILWKRCVSVCIGVYRCIVGLGLFCKGAAATFESTSRWQPRQLRTFAHSLKQHKGADWSLEFDISFVCRVITKPSYFLAGLK